MGKEADRDGSGRMWKKLEFGWYWTQGIRERGSFTRVGFTKIEASKFANYKGGLLGFKSLVRVCIF
jgi:hypothetical protein